MFYCMENLGKKDKTDIFFDEYLKKYLIEITNFNKMIEVNKEDTSFFWDMADVAVHKDRYIEDYEAIERATDVNDAVKFFVSCGLLTWNYEDKKYYIDPNQLYEKALKHKKFTENRPKVISTYTKGAKK